MDNSRFFKHKKNTDIFLKQQFHEVAENWVNLHIIFSTKLLVLSRDKSIMKKVMFFKETCKMSPDKTIVPSITISLLYFAGPLEALRKWGHYQFLKSCHGILDAKI